ncbi:MAG TPA: hypothetical protein VHF22_03860 [Planctomycetota bacterium]|nr:hypothetical protein [Planctomycetota bacterium]
MRASEPRGGGRRRGERGATLTLFAFVSGLTLLALGTVYMSSAEKAYSFAALRAREAQVYAGCDAGLVVALEKLTAQRGATLETDLELDHVHVHVRTAPKDAMRMAVTVAASAGEGADRVARELAAEVGYTSSGQAYLAGARRPQ